MSDRVAIPPDLAAKVMFASDRTCCVCRNEKLKIQIHHIDEDPSNNTFDNLAVVCLFCHVDAHSRTPFVRNMSVEVLKLYNTSWREIVRYRIAPHLDDPAQVELISEIYLEFSLECHTWRADFLQLVPHRTVHDRAVTDKLDGWELAEALIPPFSLENIPTFAPLFRFDSLRGRLNRIATRYVDMITADYRLKLLRADRGLQKEDAFYEKIEELPGLAARFGGIAETPYITRMFEWRFRSVIEILRGLDEEAFERRSSLGSIDAKKEDNLKTFRKRS